MTLPSLRDAVVVVHPVLTSIPDEVMEHALAPRLFAPGTSVIRIDVQRLELRELPDLDWGAARDILLHETDTKLRSVLEAKDGPIIYFGMAPIPLAMELGGRIAGTRRAFVFQQRHDEQASWRWKSDELTVRVELLGQPEAECRARGDVIVRVTCSHRVAQEDTLRMVPYPIGELDVVVDNPHEDVLESELDVSAVAKKFGDALDCVRRFYPNTETVHVFAAVPAGLAFRLGAQINPTIHRPVQTYQFNGRGTVRYVRAIVLGEEGQPQVTSAQRDQADSIRSHFTRALETLQAPLPPNANADGDWLRELLNCDCAPLPEALRRLGPLGRNKAILGAHVSMETREADGEFRWAPDKREWVLDDWLLLAINARIDATDIDQAARLFLLHEAIHIAAQGLTTATAERVGRLPRVLEEVDYLADVWALLHELGRALRSGDTTHERAPIFVQRLVRLMIEVLWAFDAGARPMQDVPVRRLNRYLIWYWQLLCLEQKETIDAVLRVLALKPVLEVSGPRISVVRGRVVFDLDPVTSEDVEFGALVDGSRIERIGARPGAHAGQLLAGLRNRDDSAFLGALRGIFDTIQASNGAAAR